VARAENCDVVVGLGGGSALDTAKSAASLATNGGESLDYLEVVGRGRALERPSLPFVAVPTTGGTGSETTRNAVLAHRATRTKASLRSPHLLPRLALVDPELSLSVPRETTVATGLDALTQLIEPFTSRRAQPLVDALAWDAMRRAAHALPRVVEEPGHLGARADMMLASLVSGIALAHAGLGAAHAFAGPVGGTFPVPHGFACAAVLPYVMEANLRAAPRSQAGDETVRRYAEVARALAADHGKTGEVAARGGIEHVRELCARFAVPPLSRFGVTREAVPDLVARAKLTSSMRANPVDLTDEELAGILIAAIG
jgi:alcohol dehydrogenase class IV